MKMPSVLNDIVLPKAKAEKPVERRGSLPRTPALPPSSSRAGELERLSDAMAFGAPPGKQQHHIGYMTISIGYLNRYSML